MFPLNWLITAITLKITLSSTLLIQEMLWELDPAGTKHASETAYGSSHLTAYNLCNISFVYSLIILSRASEVGSPTNQLGSGQRQDTGQEFFGPKFFTTALDAFTILLHHYRNLAAFPLYSKPHCSLWITSIINTFKILRRLNPLSTSYGTPLFPSSKN